MVGKDNNIKKLLAFIILIITALSCVPVQTTQSTGPMPQLVFDNKTYSPDIQTVQLIARTKGQQSRAGSATISLNDKERLTLTFDDLKENYQQYQLKVLHINKDWSKKSRLSAMDYLNEYNQFQIQNYEYSFDTKTPYVHYEITIPFVKLSGNYLAIVYQNNNENDIVLSQRFMVYEDQIEISPEVRVSSLVRERRENQEIFFEAVIQNVNVLNPAQEIYPVIRRNYSWLNAITGISPLRITNQNKQLSYNFYDGSLNFKGTNEFRFVDLSMINYTGSNVANIDKSTTPYSATSVINEDRSSEAYRTWDDRNGQFIIGNRERSNGTLESDYVDFTFRLKTAEIAKPIYVVGAFNDWRLTPKSQMRYNSNTGLYEANFLLKQGYYEYLFYVDGETPYQLDGSYYDTENNYDILLYYSAPQVRYDRLLGYQQFNTRPQ